MKEILSKKLMICFLMEEIVEESDGDLLEFVGEIIEVD